MAVTSASPVSRGYLRAVSGAALANAGITGLSVVSGVILARLLGPSGRGTYAAVTAYLGAAATVGECGLTTATCFYIARDRGRAADWLRTSTVTMCTLGVVTAILGSAIVSITLVGTHAGLAFPFLLAFASSPILFVGGSWVFALQALRLPRWNIVRTIQPITYLIMILAATAVAEVTVTRTIELLVASILLQAVIAARMARAVLRQQGAFSRSLLAPLFRYGFTSLLAAVPYLVNARLDQLVLAITVPATQLGNYAVAVSLSLISYPIATAFGNVALPSLAASTAESGSIRTTREIRRQALLGSGAVGTIVAAGVAVTAPFLVPRLLGPAFSAAIPLLWVLAPGGALLACNQVLGDILRGCDRSRAAARGQGAAAVVTIGLLTVLIPAMGAMGAAITSTVAYLVSFALLLHETKDDRLRPVRAERPLPQTVEGSSLG